MKIETRDQALWAVYNQIVEPSRHDLVILTDKTVERPFGWVVFYTSRAWLASRNPRDLVPGIGPVAVMREGGEVLPLSTSLPPAASIAAFEREWEKADALTKEADKR